MKLFVVFALLLGAVDARAQTAAPAAPAPAAAPAAPIAAPQTAPAAPAPAPDVTPPASASAPPAVTTPAPSAPPATAPSAAPGTAPPLPAAPTPPAYAAPPPWYPPYARRSMLESELDDLRRRRSEIGLGGPIAAVIAGGVVLGVSAVVLLVALAVDNSCSYDQYDYRYDYDDYYGCDDGDATTLYIVGGLGAALGGITLAYGIFRLVQRGGERRAIGRRMKEIRKELQYASRPSFDLRADLGSDRAGLRLQARF
jgi:hypothetical protein